MGQNDDTHTEEHTAAASAAACSDEPILMIDESACEVEEPTHSMESDEQGQHTEEVRVKAPSVNTRIKQWVPGRMAGNVPLAFARLATKL